MSHKKRQSCEQNSRREAEQAIKTQLSYAHLMQDS